MAVLSGPPSTVKMFVDAGAPLNAKTEDGNTPVSVGDCGYRQIAHSLPRSHLPRRARMIRGALFDPPLRTNNRQLHFAAVNNAPKVAILLEAGAVVEIENRWLETPLDWAEKHGFHETAGLLHEITDDPGRMLDQMQKAKEHEARLDDRQRRVRRREAVQRRKEEEEAEAAGTCAVRCYNSR